MSMERVRAAGIVEEVRFLVTGQRFQGEIMKSDDEEQNIFGWAYVSHDKDGNQIIDKSGEFVGNPKELEKAAYKFVLNSRRGRDFHGRITKSDAAATAVMIESMYFDLEKQEAMGIPPGILPQSAWWTGFHIYDRPTWLEHKAGNRPMLSVHGTGSARAVVMG